MKYKVEGEGYATEARDGVDLDILVSNLIHRGIPAESIRIKLLLDKKEFTE